MKVHIYGDDVYPIFRVYHVSAAEIARYTPHEMKRLTDVPEEKLEEWRQGVAAFRQIQREMYMAGEGEAAGAEFDTFDQDIGEVGGSDP